MQFNYLIVGQGIAGTVLAYTLLKGQKKVMVVSQGSLKSASEVAAGIYNPVTGAKLVKTWQADNLYPFLEKFYAGMEADLREKLLHPCPLYRPYDSLSEQNDRIARTARPEFKNYIQHADSGIVPENFIHHSFGGLETLHAGWLDVKKMLEKCREFFTKQEVYFNQGFDYQELSLENDYAIWKGNRFEKVIFCEGIYGMENPFFNFLPFRPYKGEILTLKIDEKNLQSIVNQGVYLFQTEANTFRAGATYDKKNINWHASEAGKTELSEKLSKLLIKKYEIIEHLAGVRPATPDRLPFVGLHPEHTQLGIFNGLGSKGVSLAPWLAQKFVDFLENGSNLTQEVQIERYFSLKHQTKYLQNQ